MLHRIKYLELKPMGRIAGLLNVAYDRVFNSGQYIGGHEVEAFENEWAEYCGAKYCVGVGNGHDALALACRYISEPHSPIKPTAFTPWKTCLPTWSAIRNGNLSPVIAGNWMVNQIVVAVHIYGHICIPKHDRDTVIIEDCAQAHGASYNGIKAGKFGQVAAWSFYPTKNLGALGDGGAVTTDDESTAQFVRHMARYGTPDKVGINSRLDPLQAAFLRVKLPFLDEWNERRRENALTLGQGLFQEGDIIVPQLQNSSDKPCWHIFNIQLLDRKHRDDLKNYLDVHGVETMIHYPSVPYPSGWKIPEAEKWADTNLSLPVGPHVTPFLCNQVVELIRQWKNK